ncbi:MAG: LytTR family DNA-binding domain-containing protein, partial [Oscillospiraceae bacterium]|nr:LytTR family DNA-binding domain-containing protein [Oscillospiraceae bacterium]
MIFKTEQDAIYKDTEVLVRYAKMDENVQRLISLLQAVDTKMKCYSEEGERLINVSDIFYIESVDKSTYAYLEKSVYRTDFRLYQLAGELTHLGFVQISKSCILNINVLEYIKPLANSRMVATL